MKSKNIRSLYLFFTIYTACSLLGTAYSLENPVESAYISFLKGEAYARPYNQDEFGFLQINIPIEPGDELITEENSFTEIMFPSGIVIWVNSETFMKINKDSHKPGVEILKGSVFIRNSSEADGNIPYLVDTPSAMIKSMHKSLVKVDLNEIGEVTVEVWEGNAGVYFENGDVSIEEGKRAFIGVGGKYISIMSLERKTSSGFITWALERDKKLQENVSLAYLEEDLAGSSYLSDYGEWYYDSSISAYVWEPYVNRTWRPYLDGRWFYHSRGYYWVSYEPWGWVPFHYGRWIRNTYGRWCWIPGYLFSPAWVEFISFGRYYGWAPVGYGYHPHYSYHYPGGIHNHTHSFIIGCNAFIFVHKDCLHSTHGCNANNKNSFQPLTEDTIDQGETIIPISQPIEAVDKGGARFNIPEIKENFPGTVLKNIVERFRNNLPARDIQNIREIEPVSNLFPGRNGIQRFAAGKKVLKPLKHINSPEKILNRKISKKRILAKKKVVVNREIRVKNSDVRRHPREGNTKRRFISTSVRKKGPFKTFRTALKGAPIKIVKRSTIH